MASNGARAATPRDRRRPEARRPRSTSSTGSDTPVSRTTTPWSSSSTATPTTTRARPTARTATAATRPWGCGCWRAKGCSGAPACAPCNRRNKTMSEALSLTTPLTDDDVIKLRTGDRVLINGVIYTARDAAHRGVAAAHGQATRIGASLTSRAVSQAASNSACFCSRLRSAIDSVVNTSSRHGNNSAWLTMILTILLTRPPGVT